MPKLTVAFKAEDCKYYTVARHGEKQSKSEQGVKPFARATADFVPDVGRLAEVGSDTLQALGKILSAFDQSQTRILMQVLSDHTHLQRYRLSFGQPVYINLSAPYEDYLDCWFRANVIGVCLETDCIYLSGSLSSDSGISTRLLVPRSSFLTKTQFKKHRSALQQKDRLVTPISRRSNLTTHRARILLEQQDNDDFNMPLIESVAKALGVKTKMAVKKLAPSASARVMEEQDDGSGSITFTVETN